MDTLPENSAPPAEQEKKWSAIFQEIWVDLRRSETRGNALLRLWVIFRAFAFIWPSAVIVLGGIGLMVLLAVGQSVSIGFYAAWKVYKYYWIFSPLFGPVLVAAAVLPILIIKAISSLISRRFGSRSAEWFVAAVMTVLLGGGCLVAGFFGAREDNPMLNSRPANMEELSKSLGEQNRVLGKMSESGKVLLDQLNSTESELENTKKQLTATLTNFDVQQQAAGQVAEELKRIDARQKQIVLQTEELQRILEGQQPITRHDLQRANLEGLVFGLVAGFITSFLASMAYSAFGKKKLVTG